MKILGLSFFYHDAAAALVVDGVPIAMAEEERFSRTKHDARFPQMAIDFVLQEAKISAGDLDYVIFYEKPFLKFDRIMKTLLATFPSPPKVFVETFKHLFLDKLWIKSLIVKQLKIDPKIVLFTEHHLSHAASAFLCSPFDRAAIITVDGVGEWATATIGKGNGNHVELWKEMHFPHSIGLLYSAFTAFLGFEVNEGEYKVMGMAPYGKPKYVDQVKKILTTFNDGSIALDLRYFSFHHSLQKSYSPKFEALFGRPRDPQAKFFTRQTGWPSFFGEMPGGETYKRLAMAQEHYADIAASIQVVTEEIVVNIAKTAHQLTGCKKLCIGGGVGLNSVANWKILSAAGFDEIFVQPAAGDSGGALGAALFVYNSALNNKRQFIMKHAYFGKSYTHEDIRQCIGKNNLAKRTQFIADEDQLVEEVAEQLVNGKVVGWFNGKFEWGPRALGHRSILADPRRHDMKDTVNTKIKFREPYRPFAPSVLAEHATEFFDLGEAGNHYPARFMLYVVPVKKERRITVPAITHVDGSARPQLVYREYSPRYWKLINRFYKKTGVPMLLNTSLNLKGEPIVNTPDDAYHTFATSAMDTLVLENFVITREP